MFVRNFVYRCLYFSENKVCVRLFFIWKMQAFHKILFKTISQIEVHSVKKKIDVEKKGED